MILDEIVYKKRKQLDEEMDKVKIEDFIRLLGNKESRDFTGSLAREGISIIAEIKKASPSKGIIKEDFDHRLTAEIYEKIDIDAISVLTEKHFFLGSDEYIEDVKEISKKPVLRKDFIIDEYQLYQSKAIGADAVLLIAAVLKEKLKKFYEKTLELGLHCLMEVHDLEELQLALETGCRVIGINNRNLKNFETRLETTEKLIKYIPSDKIVVSESGIKSPEDILYLESVGAKAVLIGETFMRDLDEIRSFIAKVRG